MFLFLPISIRILHLIIPIILCILCSSLIILILFLLLLLLHVTAIYDDFGVDVIIIANDGWFDRRYVNEFIFLDLLIQWIQCSSITIFQARSLKSIEMILPIILFFFIFIFLQLICITSIMDIMHITGKIFFSFSLAMFMLIFLCVIILLVNMILVDSSICLLVLLLFALRLELIHLPFF